MLSKSLLKKSSIYFVGNFSSKIMSALLIPIYAYSVSSKDLGYFDFTQTIMGVLSPIIVIAIWEAVLKFLLSTDNQTDRRKILTSSASFSLFMAILFSLIVVLINYYHNLQLRFLPLIILMIVLHSLVYVWQYYARGVGENKLYVISGICSTIVNFLMVITLVVVNELGIMGLLIAYNLGQLSIIIIIERKIGVIKYLKFQDFDFKIVLNMVAFSAPLVLNLLSAWMIAGLGRMLITLNLGAEDNGTYSFANKFSLIIVMIGSVITMAIIEEAILSVKDKSLKENFNKTLETLFSIFQLFAIFSVPMIVIFYEFISNTEYYNSISFALWLLIYAVLNTMASNVGSVFQAINKTKYQFYTTFFGALITVAIAMSLINLIGIYAVVIAQIAGAFTMLMSRYYLINKFVKLKMNWTPIISKFLIFTLVVIVCLKMGVVISIILQIIFIILIFVLGKEHITQVISKVKRRIKK